jgi:hypothetical protein
MCSDLSVTSAATEANKSWVYQIKGSMDVGLRVLEIIPSRANVGGFPDGSKGLPSDDS